MKGEGWRVEGEGEGEGDGDGEGEGEGMGDMRTSELAAPAGSMRAAPSSFNALS